jgi:hypothetical protein
VYETDKSTPVHREQRKLQRLARTNPSGADLSARLTGTIPETSELFNSEYKPCTEWGEDPRQE